MSNVISTALTPTAPLAVAPVAGAEVSPNGAPSTADPLKWPTLDDVREDWAWAHEVEENGGFGEYVHKHVAIFNKTVVGSGTDCAQLRHDMASKFGVHPERIIITYIDSNFVDV